MTWYELESNGGRWRGIIHVEESDELSIETVWYEQAEDAEQEAEELIIEVEGLI